LRRSIAKQNRFPDFFRHSTTYFYLTAVFTISPAGVILGCNPIADSMWRGSGQRLAGEFFPDLFQLDIKVKTAEDRASQWEVLREAAMDAPLRLNARMGHAEPIPVWLKLDPTRNGSTGPHYQAFLETRPAATASPPVRLSPSPAPPTQSPPPASLPPEPSAPAGQAKPQEEKAGKDAYDESLSFCWRLLEEANHLGCFSLDFGRSRFHFSKGWKALLGYAQAELPDQHETLIKLVHPEDSDATPDCSERDRPNARKPFTAEFRMRHKAGHYIWIQSVGVQEFDATGELSSVAGIHIDITERKEMEEETLQNEERYLTLIHRARIGLFDLDLRTRKAYISPSLSRLLGYEEGYLDAMPDTFRRLLQAKDFNKQDLAAMFTDATGGGRSSFVRELRMQTRDGDFINFQTHIVRITNRRGDLQRVIGFHVGAEGEEAAGWRGTTPPEAMSCALRSVNEAVVLTDPHGKITFFNPKAERLTGMESAEVAGLPLHEAVPLLHIGNRHPATNLADEVLSSGTPILFSRHFLLHSATAPEPTKIILSCLPLMSESDRILGAALIFRDPAEMSLTPEELVKSNRLDSLGLLAGAVAHDFNNLLTTIVGGISLARELHEWEPLENCERAGLAAKSLTRQLLTFSRGRETGRKVVHIGNLVRDCARLASAGSRVQPSVEIPADLFPAYIEVSRMGQVLQNLVINAIEAMGTAGGTLRISGANITLAEGQIAGLTAGDYLKVSLQDTGPGIPKEILPRIFDRFFTTKPTGSGIGLSTVHSILHDHNGQITVASEVGVGSTFTLYLPRSNAAVEAEGRKKPTLKFGTGRVLFMDDDEDITALAAGMLKRLDYEFDLARNGEEALALYRRYLHVQRPYDAVILDLTIIGGMGGEETLTKLLQMDPEVRAIVSSGYSTEESQTYYLNQGFAGVLSKPYRSEEMGKVLRRVLGKDGD
jgi:two-component system, cell cycle sensor histidine kinase and response regulator CckA